jgi:hypothetical protein
MKRFVLVSLGLVVSAGAARAGVILSDDFTYTDGAISSVSGGLWAVHSGTDSGTTALNVTGGKAVVNQPDTTGGRADVNRPFTDTSAAVDPNTNNTQKYYSSFTVNFSALPLNGDADGSYFAHLKSSAANEFYARVGASTNGAAAGTFRLAIANETWSAAASIEYPVDLELNKSYTVVTRFDLATDQATLWIGPTSEDGTSVTATDAVGYTATGNSINAYALRQGTSGSTAALSGGPGTIAVDNLLVGTSFADVVAGTPVPEPTGLALLGLAGAVAGRRRRRHA